LFWWSLIGLLLLPQSPLLPGIRTPTSEAMAGYFFIWGIFTSIISYSTLPLTHALQFVFSSMMVFFFLLTASEITGNAELNRLMGYEGVVCGFIALYTALTELIQLTSYDPNSS
jgi:hypothetical protein